MKSVFSILAVAFLALSIFSHGLAQQGNDDAFEKYLQQQNAAFNKYSEDNEAQFQKYVEEIEKKWAAFQSSTKKEWVAYSGDTDTKSVVDFEKGEVEITTLVPVKDKAKAKDIAKKKIESQVQSIVSQDNAAGEVVLKDQLQTGSGQVVSNNNAGQYANEVAGSAQVTQNIVKGKDGIERLEVKVKIKMVPKHLEKRAGKYLPTVRKYCQKNNLDIAMVMALMHTESYFNPLAKSHVPAYGLMQLVPRSGGREAMRYVFNKDVKPKPSYLYNPTQNIELGTGLLAKTRKYEFGKVKDTQSALYCIICAYNTGAGNVARAILPDDKNRKGRLRRAVEKINTMTTQQVYDQLVNHLPYEETQKYIKKITQRVDNYAAWR